MPIRLTTETELIVHNDGTAVSVVEKRSSKTIIHLTAAAAEDLATRLRSAATEVRHRNAT